MSNTWSHNSCTLAMSASLTSVPMDTCAWRCTYKQHHVSVSNTNTVQNEHCRRQCHPTQRTSSARSSGKMSARSTSSALVRGPIFFTTRAYLQQTMNIVALKYISLLARSLYLRQIVGHNAGQLWEMPTIPNNSKMITSLPPHTPAHTMLLLCYHSRTRIA